MGQRPLQSDPVTYGPCQGTLTESKLKQLSRESEQTSWCVCVNTCILVRIQWMQGLSSRSFFLRQLDVWFPFCHNVSQQLLKSVYVLSRTRKIKTHKKSKRTLTLNQNKSYIFMLYINHYATWQSKHLFASNKQKDNTLTNNNRNQIWSATLAFIHEYFQFCFSSHPPLLQQPN